MTSLCLDVTLQFNALYTDAQNRRMYISIDGIYEEKSNTFIPYDNIAMLPTNTQETGKIDVSQIYLELLTGDDISLTIDGKAETLIDGKMIETNDTWLIYSFLRKVCRC